MGERDLCDEEVDFNSCIRCHNIDVIGLLACELLKLTYNSVYHNSTEQWLLFSGF